MSKIFKIGIKTSSITFNFSEHVSRDKSSTLRLEIQHYSRNDNSTSDGRIRAPRRYNPRNNDEQVNRINKTSACVWNNHN